MYCDRNRKHIVYDVFCDIHTWLCYIFSLTKFLRFFVGHSPPNMSTNGMPSQIPRTTPDSMLLVLNQPNPLQLQSNAQQPTMPPNMMRPPQHGASPHGHSPGQRYPNVATSPVLSPPTSGPTRLPTKSHSMEGEFINYNNIHTWTSSYLWCKTHYQGCAL